jgi:DNA glycosylase AlkZ-like
MTPETLTLRRMNRATLARQMLLERHRLSTEKAIERLVAMQAQFPRPPFVGLWSRLEGFERAELAKLLEKRKVVRATFLRGTLHYVTARDFLGLRPLLQPGLDAGLKAILRDRWDQVDMNTLTASTRKILAKTPRTFEEIRAAFASGGAKADVRAMAYSVRLTVPLVQVPVGREAPWSFPANCSFALADKWLGRPLPRPKDDRPDALVLRYLAGYGPSSVADVQAWSGLPKLGDSLERLRHRLRVFRGEKGRELFDLPDAPRPDEDVPVPVRFVPDYDNLIATRADERFVAKRDRPRVFLSALRIAATVLVDGFVVATWKIERKKTAATLVVVPFAPLSPKTRKEVLAEGEALVRFAEPDATSFEVRLGR